MTTPQPISPLQRPSLKSKARHNLSLPCKLPELWEIFLVLMMREIRLRLAQVAQDVMIIPTAASTMTTKVARPTVNI